MAAVTYSWPHVLPYGYNNKMDDRPLLREEEGTIDVRPFERAGDLSPTVQAAKLEDKLRICLFGFVRGERLNIYSHEERIIK